MEKERIFLYQDPLSHDKNGYPEYPDAYFIIPSSLGYNIFHQYGCTGCYHFEIKGFAVPVPDLALAKRLERLLGCEYDYQTLYALLSKYGIELDVIRSEALALLKNGWYIATCNCD